MGVQLVRLSCVSSGSKLSEAEDKENKQIASLIIPIEWRLGVKGNLINMIKPQDTCLS